MTIRAGAGTPLVLLHGVTGSERMWERVIEETAAFHDTIAVTQLGHRGGHPAHPRDDFGEVVEDAERMLDLLGLERPHLAGNSMGGWVALELARRGRASTVCALSPAGFWDSKAGDHQHGAERLRRTVSLARRTRAVLPIAARSGRFRRWVLRDNAVHGDRLSAAELVGYADDLLECAIRDSILSTTQQVQPWEQPHCPVTLAWSEHDRVLPPERHRRIALERIPHAEWRVLPGVGHVPMIDDPALVADAILRSTGARR